MRNHHPKAPSGALLLALGLLFLSLAAPALAGSKKLFEISDPRGDDHGDGRMEYPLNINFERGDLDLLSFSAKAERGGTLFQAVFARPLREPGRGAIDDLGTELEDIARHGFYNLNIDIYIDQDRRPASGQTAMLPGRKAEIDANHAWERAIVLTPRPAEARGAFKRMVRKTLTAELRKDDPQLTADEVDAMRTQVPDDVDRNLYFPNRVRVQGPKISFFVPDSFLGGPADPSWSYVIAVSGSDLIQSFDLASTFGYGDGSNDRLMIVPISPGTWRDRFGGAREADELHPPLVDIVVPAGYQQELLISDFDGRAGKPARLPGVVPAEAPRGD